MHFEHQTIEDTALPAIPGFARSTPPPVLYCTVLYCLHCTDFFKNIANFRNLVVFLRRLQSKLPNPNNNGRTYLLNEFKLGNIVHLR